MKIKIIIKYVWPIGLLALLWAVVAGGIGCSGSSSSTSSPPYPPANLMATAGNKQVSLSWNSSTNATSYKIYDTTISGGPYVKVCSAALTGTAVTGLTDNTPYYFVVTAANSAGESKYSTEANATPHVTINTYDTAEGFNGIAIDGSGNIWVINACGLSGGSCTSKVTALTPTGTIMGTYNQIGAPEGIAIDSSGNIWVDDIINASMYNERSLITELNHWGSTIATLDPGFTYFNVVLDSSGNLWFPASGSITELSPSGITIGTYRAGSGSSNLAIDGSGNIWMTNSSDNTITKLNSTGVTIGTYNVGNFPQGIAIDPSGNIWVVNSGSNNIFELNSSGVTIGSYPISAINIAIDNAGNIWVTTGKKLIELSPTGSTTDTYSIDDAGSMAIDSSGNIWIAHNGLTEVVGVAVGPQYWPYTGPQWP